MSTQATNTDDATITETRTPSPLSIGVATTVGLLAMLLVFEQVIGMPYSHYRFELFWILFSMASGWLVYADCARQLDKALVEAKREAAK